MKLTTFVFLIFIILIYSCHPKKDENTNNFQLKGTISNQDSGTVVMSYLFDDTYVRDTAKMKNGKFIFKGKVFEPTMATLRDAKDLELAVFYLEPTKMKISIVKDKLLGCDMTGSRTQSEFDLINKLESPIWDSLLILKKKNKIVSDSLEKSQSQRERELLELKKLEIETLWSQAEKKRDSIRLKFVLENPKSFLAPYYLHGLEEKEMISLDSVRSVMNGFDISIKNSKNWNLLSEDIRKKEKNRIGQPATDFKATDINKQTVSLSHFKGKSVVLLDFWASWCVPCRESMPNLKAIYNKYHDKGLEIIAVSVDENRDEWIIDIKNLNIDKWHNIQIAEEWPDGPWTDTDIYSNYYYRGIPYQILIDKNGTVISKSEGYSKENEEALDKMLSDIFDN